MNQKNNNNNNYNKRIQNLKNKSWLIMIQKISFKQQALNLFLQMKAIINKKKKMMRKRINILVIILQIKQMSRIMIKVKLRILIKIKFKLIINYKNNQSKKN